MASQTSRIVCASWTLTPQGLSPVWLSGICCETTLVRAAATSCKCTFLALSCAQLYSPYVGEAERRIREVRCIYSTSYLYIHVN